jgi:nicotinamidase-related amidase
MRAHTKHLLLLLAGIILTTAAPALAETRMLEVAQRTRNANNEVVTTTKTIDPATTGVMVIDSWNYHWCMTATERVGAMVPRWNRALECARKLGMTVMWAPSDVAGNYVGTPQRERALAVPYGPVPAVRQLDCTFTVARPPCMCGKGFPCLSNYGFDAICPALNIAQDDYIVCGLAEVYGICKQKGLKHIIFTGLHTNICLFGKPDALSAMYGAGVDCSVARDLNDAYCGHDADAGITPDDGTARTDDDLERAGVPLINLMEELRKAGVWDDNWVVETVRIAPWGQPARPYVFSGSTKISLRAPWLENVEIRYTLDAGEVTTAAPQYQGPVVVEKTATLRAAAFRGGRKVSLDTSAYYVLLPALPPVPDITLDSVTPMQDLYGQLNHDTFACLWQPLMNQSYEKRTLQIRAVQYDKGVGMRAPACLRYAIDPQWDRFVALAGIDDNLLAKDLGRNLAMYPSVVFKVFIDGQCVAHSPVLRISQPPWRFDVKIPAGSRRISLVADDEGNHNPFNLANWVRAGFILKK